MIPSREEILNIINSNDYKPIKLHGIAEKLGVELSEEKELQKLLEKMQKEGYLLIDERKKRKIVKAADEGIFRGTFVGTENKFGFVEVEDDNNTKLYIHSSDVENAIDGDLVVAEIVEYSEGEEYDKGRIVRVLERNIKEVIGTFKKSKSGKSATITPDNKRITKKLKIDGSIFNGAENGDKVLCTVIRDHRDKEFEGFRGRIKSIVSKMDEKDIEVKTIIAENHLITDFSQKAKIDAKNMLNPTEKELKNRLDLRDLKVFTIDGEDSKDLDDAISIEMLDNGNYELGVHIADVAHYVKEGSKIDVEAAERATSVYLTDRVIPMLPEEISNGVCSLNQGEDKLAISVIMEIDSNGEVLNHKIKESVINSKLRTNYNDVSDILENDDEELIEKYSDFILDFMMAEELAKILNTKRDKRGAITLGGEKTKVVLNSEGEPISIEIEERRTANNIIEEFMIVANETIAEHFYRLKVPFVYRVHENMEKESAENFNKFISDYGYKLSSDTDIKEQRKELKSILDESNDMGNGDTVKSMMLRSLDKARYSSKCIGHFGLASEFYCHFTSPIRRYPDLMVHRIIKEVINGRMNEEEVKHFDKVVLDISEYSSERERFAEKAEREVNKYYTSIYMRKETDTEFEGKIIGINKKGVFVELPNRVCGVASSEEFKEKKYYSDPENFCVYGENDEKIYEIGDFIKVKVLKEFKNIRKLDFEIIKENGAA